MPLIVKLEAESDYLKRLSKVVSLPADGVTRVELDSASKAAQDDVLLAMAEIGFNISGWTSEATTPTTVVEIIKMLGSAKVWHRIIYQYDNETNFQDTYGYSLLTQANASLEDVAARRTLMSAGNDRTVIRATEPQEGKGSPRLGLPGNREMIVDSEINDFISEHGPYGARHQIKNRRYGP